MANIIVKDIATSIKSAGFFAILSDECTDISNKEQLTVCLRWIDKALEPHEDFVGFYHIPNINADTIVGAIKDTLTRLDLSLNNCRGQCYDAGGPMAGWKNGVAAQIKAQSVNAHFTHCHGHALSLAVKDTTSGCKLLRDAMDTTREICKLIKLSPKRQEKLEQLKAEMQLDTPGLKVLCPTRWTIRAESYKRVLENYDALQLEWDECLEGKLDSEMRARIIGVKAQMESFDYFFALNLGQRIYSHTDNLSKTLQQGKLSAVDGQRNAELVASVLQNMRTDDNFSAFYAVVNSKATEHEIAKPSLPRNRSAPRRFEVGDGEATFPRTCEDRYRRIYFEAIDLSVNAIKSRFEQPGFKAYAQMESLLMNCLNGEDYAAELAFVESEYSGDIDLFQFESQLTLFKAMLPNETYACFRDIYSAYIQLSLGNKCLVSEVEVLMRLILVNPATDAVGERSFSTARRLKSWLRSSMNQCRFNNLAILTVHKERTDAIDLVSVANQFSSLNENRVATFGTFKKEDFDRAH